MDYKIIIGVIVVLLTFIGYVPYMRDVLKNTTTPHMFTWFIWTVASAIACALQILGGAGVGALATVGATALCFVVFLLSLTKKDKNITWWDAVFLVMSLLSLFLWLVVKQPVASVILIVAVDVFGFMPTIRKSWNAPYSETLFSYELNTIRHGLSFFALQQFNILTVLYPIAWTLANLVFVFILVTRRKKFLRKEV